MASRMMSLKDAFSAGALAAARRLGAQELAPEMIAEAYGQWRESHLGQLAMTQPDPIGELFHIKKRNVTETFFWFGIQIVDLTQKVKELEAELAGDQRRVSHE